MSQQKDQLKHQQTTQARSRPKSQVHYLDQFQVKFPLINPQEFHN